MLNAMRFAALLCLLALTFTEGSFCREQPESGIAEEPARHSPEWLRAGVIYEIYVREFRRREI